MRTLPVNEEKVKTARPEKTKIGYVTGSFPNTSETFILNEMIELENLGFSITIFSVNKGEKAVGHKKLDLLKAQTHYLDHTGWHTDLHIYWLKRRPMAYLKTILFSLRNIKKVSITSLGKILRIGWVCRKINIQHLHAHFANIPTHLAMGVRILANIPYSFTSHAEDLYVNNAGLKNKLHNCGFAVTISEYNKRFMAQLEIPAQDMKKVHVIHCGIDPSAFSQTKQFPSANASPLRILSVARLVAQKGTDTLIRACAILKHKNVEFICTIVGDGLLRSALEQMVRHENLCSEVSFLGTLPDTGVIEEMSKADVFVLPCKHTPEGEYDGIPVALMEAMSMGLVVLTTPVSGNPELVTHEKTGYLFRENDHNTLAELIQQILATPKERLGEIKREAKGEIIKKFNIKNNAKKLSQLFLSK